MRKYCEKVNYGNLVFSESIPLKKVFIVKISSPEEKIKYNRDVFQFGHNNDKP